MGSVLNCTDWQPWDSAWTMALLLAVAQLAYCSLYPISCGTSQDQTWPLISDLWTESSLNSAFTETLKMNRDALCITICGCIHSRTLESRHYCTTIISFYLSEESPQTHGGHLKPLNVHHWLQRKLRVVLLIVYTILLCSTWVGGDWENTLGLALEKL